MSSSFWLNIESAKPMHSTMCDANPPAVNDFSCGRQSNLSFVRRSKCLRVVSASCSNSVRRESFICICDLLSVKDEGRQKTEDRRQETGGYNNLTFFHYLTSHFCLLLLTPDSCLLTPDS